MIAMTGQRRTGRIFSLVALLAMFGIALHTPFAAAAQEDDLSFKDLDGYQRGVTRTYMGDMSAMMNLDALATPGADISTPDLDNLGLFMMLGMVGQFDNSDNASKAVDKVVESFNDGSSEEMSAEIKEVDIDQIGDKTKAFTGTMSEDGMSGTITLIVVQKGEFLYAAMGVAFGSDPVDAVTSFIKDMTENKPGDGDGTFNADGTSTGGLWDVFPSADADYLKGLTPTSDEDLAESGV